MKRSIVLMVLDGWGIGQPDGSNPIYTVKPKTVDYIKHNFPSGALQASGIAVGLPWGEMGNSEVGHLTMGAGQVLYQHYPRISLAVKNGSFFKNQAIIDAFQWAKSRGTKINFVGLIGQANVHSSLEHLQALLTIAQQMQVDYALHLFTDGRDSAPQSAWGIIKQIPTEKIASISGRYYAMDRDKHWNLTQQAYQALVGQAPVIQTADIQAHLQKTYARKFNDEYIVPATVGSADRGISDGDAVFIFDFREDRVRQIGEALINPYFSQFPVKKLKDLHVASMTQIREDFKIPVAFEPQSIKNPLGKVLAENGRTQLRMAETQKYAHVTFFFNGLNDAPFPNEYRVLIPSRMVSHQETDPEMMAPAITARLIQAIEEEAFDFILVNYANPDMIAHTGNYDASCKAVQIIDDQIAKVMAAALLHNAIVLITADHGNVERLYDPITGEPETKHDTSPVPVYLIAKEYMRPHADQDISKRERFVIGMLSDIAPTILALMGLPKSSEMTGQSLLPQLLE
ncbi:MAG: 2,3-bisphosphoglycerate-independent phosphoglycerate mutase [Candidatus Paceibacterota bacterium]|jgi:2,3-bisphosphoglycerate-independent phosphoglycerate mutase